VWAVLMRPSVEGTEPNCPKPGVGELGHTPISFIFSILVLFYFNLFIQI
jgi:hypothetical protein